MKCKAMFAAVLLSLLGACSNTSMSGGGGARSGADQTSTKTSTDQADSLGKQSDDDGFVAPVIEPTSASVATSTADPEPTVTNEVVDGMEVITSCDACIARAQQLSRTIGFEASKSNSINLGFYKVEPSRGLCDIHFKKRLWDETADHDGRDSVLGNQVALYCPCNCGWATTE